MNTWSLRCSHAQRVRSTALPSIPLALLRRARRIGLAATHTSHAKWVSSGGDTFSTHADGVFDVVAVAADALAPVAGLVCDSVAYS